MKTLGAFAIFAALVILPTVGCGYHHHSFRDRTEIRRAHEEFRRAGWEAREELRRARQDVRRELRQAREDFAARCAKLTGNFGTSSAAGNP